MRSEAIKEAEPCTKKRAFAVALRHTGTCADTDRVVRVRRNEIVHVGGKENCELRRVSQYRETGEPRVRDRGKLASSRVLFDRGGEIRQTGTFACNNNEML